MLQSFSFLMRWISWLGIVVSTLSILWPTLFRSIIFVTGLAAVGSGLLSEFGVEVLVVLAFEGGAEALRACAVMDAQVMAGVLAEEAVPAVPFDSTRVRVGKVAVTA